MSRHKITHYFSVEEKQNSEYKNHTEPTKKEEEAHIALHKFEAMQRIPSRQL